MKLLKQKGPRCLLYATAMVLDVAPEEIIEFLGHDCIVGLHMQESQAFALSKGFLFAPFEPQPMLGIAATPLSPPSWSQQPWLQFEGIMLGETRKGNYHAVAWDGKQILDPAIEPNFSGYHQFWAKTKISNHIDFKIN